MNELTIKSFNLEGQELSLVLRENLEGILQEVFNTSNIEELKSIVITDDQVGEYKELNAKANNMFKEIDGARIKLHDEQEASYKNFFAAYKKEFKAPLDEVINHFKEQINAVEAEALNTKIRALETYLELAVAGTELEGIKLEALNIDKVIKSKDEAYYHDQIDAKVNNILTGFATINSFVGTEKDFILIEYKKHYDLAKAITDGKAYAAQYAAMQAPVAADPEPVEEHLEEPVEPEAVEELITYKLEFNTTKAKTKLLKEFLAKNNINYEFMN